MRTKKEAHEKKQIENKQKEKKQKEKKPYRFLTDFLIKTGLLILVVTLVILFVLVPYRATGNAMSPFVRDGDLCFFYKLEEIYYNDVVLYEDANKELRIGRVVAVPGQTVDFPEEGGYEIDGYQPVEEIPYETYGAESTTVSFPLTLGEEAYFLLHDFRPITTDSREQGAIQKSQIKGKLLVLFRRRGF